MLNSKATNIITYNRVSTFIFNRLERFCMIYLSTKGTPENPDYNEVKKAQRSFLKIYKKY